VAPPAFGCWTKMGRHLTFNLCLPNKSCSCRR